MLVWLYHSCWGGGVVRWRGDDNVRALVLARCCWRRGEDTTINIRQQVGWGHVTKGGDEVVVVREEAVATIPPSIAPPTTIVIALFLSIAIVPLSIASAAAAIHCNRRLHQPLRPQRLLLSFGGEEEVAVMTTVAKSHCAGGSNVVVLAALKVGGSMM